VCKVDLVFCHVESSLACRSFHHFISPMPCGPIFWCMYIIEWYTRMPQTLKYIHLRHSVWVDYFVESESSCFTIKLNKFCRNYRPTLIDWIGSRAKAKAKEAEPAIGTTDSSDVLPTRKTVSSRRPTRVARYFLAQFTNTGQNIPNYHKIYQMSIKYTKCLQNRPNVYKVYQMSAK
jgi:hypothetical protein